MDMIKNASELNFNKKRGLIFCLLFITIIISSYILRVYKPNSYAIADIGWQIQIVQSLAQDGDLDLKNQLENNPLLAADQIALGKNGQWYPLHEFLMSIFTVPLYFLMGLDACLFFNALIAIGTAAVLFLICAEYSSIAASFFAVVLTTSSGILLGASYSFSNDLFGCFFLILSYYLVLKRQDKTAGFVWGLSVLARTINAVSLPVFLFATILFNKNKDRKFHCAVNFLAAGFPFFIIFCLSNYWMFGSLWETSYWHWVVVDKNGDLVSKSYKQYFSQPLVLSFLRTFFEREGGFFAGAPLALLSFSFGLRLFFIKYRKDFLFFMLLCLVFFLFAVFFQAFPGNWGNRYLISIALLSALPLSILFDQFLIKFTN